MTCSVYAIRLHIRRRRQVSFSFLRVKRDSKGRKVGDEGYDPTTISISLANGERLTPAMQQYWDIKRENADVLLFFKVGKFYEMFEEDALVSILPYANSKIV